MTRDQAIGAALVGAAGLVAYVGLRKRSERVVKCDNISNRTGGTLSTPCPTEGPLDVCTYDGDYVPWRERLSIQLEAVNRLQRAMEDLGLLDDVMHESIRAYAQRAATLIGQFPPAWTTESDLAPILAELRVGCDLLNQGNAAISKAGRPEYIVQESGETAAWAKQAHPGLPVWVPILGIAAAAGAAYYFGRRSA